MANFNGLLNSELSFEDHCVIMLKLSIYDLMRLSQVNDFWYQRTKQFASYYYQFWNKPWIIVYNHVFGREEGNQDDDEDVVVDDDDDDDEDDDEVGEGREARDDGEEQQPPETEEEQQRKAILRIIKKNTRNPNEDDTDSVILERRSEHKFKVEEFFTDKCPLLIFPETSKICIVAKYEFRDNQLAFMEQNGFNLLDSNHPMELAWNLNHIAETIELIDEDEVMKDIWVDKLVTLVNNKQQFLIGNFGAAAVNDLLKKLVSGERRAEKISFCYGSPLEMISRGEVLRGLEHRIAPENIIISDRATVYRLNFKVPLQFTITDFIYDMDSNLSD